MRIVKLFIQITVLLIVVACGGGGGGGGGSDPSTGSSPSVPNALPIANAGPLQNVVVASLVKLDGSQSSDADRDTLTFIWTLTAKPAGSVSSLNGATTPSPTFTADMPGAYTASLLVNDGKANSIPSAVNINASVLNAVPVAKPVTPQSVTTGTLVTLDGSGSSDADGDPLSYSWVLKSKPTGSTTALVGIVTRNPSFVADVSGSYLVSLVVRDGKANSLEAAVTITATTVNASPIARATGPASVNIGALVQLDGTGSSDANNDPLTYKWAWVSKPTGSVAQLSSVTSARPTFTADLAGVYVPSLVVNDGKLTSEVSSISIQSSPAAFAFSASDKSIEVFSVDTATGSLASSGSVATNINSASLRLHPNGKYLYAGDNEANSVTLYSINQKTGALVRLSQVRADLPPPGFQVKVGSIQADPQGRLLYVFTTRTDNLTGKQSFVLTTLPINPQNGQLTERSSSFVSPNAWSAAYPHPAGKYLYIPFYSDNRIGLYSVDFASGVLTYKGFTETADGSSRIVFDTLGKFAYVPSYDAHKVESYSVDQSTGTLTKIDSQFTGITNDAARNPRDLVLHPSGRYLYTGNYGTGNISTFKLDPVTGALGLSVATTLTNGAWPGTTSLTISSNGKYLYASSGFFPETTIFSIDQNSGALAQVGKLTGGDRLAITNFGN